MPALVDRHVHKSRPSCGLRCHDTSWPVHNIDGAPAWGACACCGNGDSLFGRLRRKKLLTVDRGMRRRLDAVEELVDVLVAEWDAFGLIEWACRGCERGARELFAAFAFAGTAAAEGRVMVAGPPSSKIATSWTTPSGSGSTPTSSCTAAAARGDQCLKDVLRERHGAVPFAMPSVVGSALPDSCRVSRWLRGLVNPG